MARTAISGGPPVRWTRTSVSTNTLNVAMRLDRTSCAGRSRPRPRCASLRVPRSSPPGRGGPASEPASPGFNWFDFEGHRRLEFGIPAGPGGAGMGYATEASRAVLAIAAETLRGEILAMIDPTNRASQNVARKLGFTSGSRRSWTAASPTSIGCRSDQRSSSGGQSMSSRKPSTRCLSSVVALSS